MRTIKNILFILSIILGTIGIIGVGYVYYNYNGITDNIVLFMVCQIIAIVFSWSFVILEYKEKGFFKKRGKKNV